MLAARKQELGIYACAGTVLPVAVEAFAHLLIADVGRRHADDTTVSRGADSATG